MAMLNAIAEDLAKIIHSIICISVSQFIVYEWLAIKNPISAKGMANIVWLNLISDKYFFIIQKI